jgi:hypothetical protein
MSTRNVFTSSSEKKTPTSKRWLRSEVSYKDQGYAYYMAF